MPSCAKLLGAYFSIKATSYSRHAGVSETKPLTDCFCPGRLQAAQTNIYGIAPRAS
jgi:hypothetical protein